MENIFATFIQTSGLYQEKEINENNINDLIEIIGGEVKLDCFCPKCKTLRVFSMTPITTKNELYETVDLASTVRSFLNKPKKQGSTSASPFKWCSNQTAIINRVLQLNYECSMDNSHHLDFILLTEGNRIRKIGQYPSLADLEHHELKEFEKVITKEDLSSIKRACGLYSHGIGIGSYVYLRRIIENLILSAKQEAINNGSIPDNQESKRVVELIPMLKGYLPDLLVENKALYGILSKGIHALSEEECLEFFPVLYQGILLIARDKEESRRKKAVENDFTNAISKISSELKNSSN